MENNEGSPGHPPGISAGISAAEARHSLRAVAEVEQSTRWRPHPGVLLLLSTIFGSLIVLWVWGMPLWGVGAFLILGALVFLLRRQVYNPQVRSRPWQSLDNQVPGVGRDQLISVGIVFWPMAGNIFPAEPRWVALILGVLAAAHFFLFLRQSGKILERP